MPVLEEDGGAWLGYRGREHRWHGDGTDRSRSSQLSNRFGDGISNASGIDRLEVPSWSRKPAAGREAVAGADRCRRSGGEGPVSALRVRVHRAIEMPVRHRKARSRPDPLAHGGDRLAADRGRDDLPRQRRVERSAAVAVPVRRVASVPRRHARRGDRHRDAGERDQAASTPSLSHRRTDSVGGREPSRSSESVPGHSTDQPADPEDGGSAPRHGSDSSSTRRQRYLATPMTHHFSMTASATVPAVLRRPAFRQLYPAATLAVAMAIGACSAESPESEPDATEAPIGRTVSVSDDRLTDGLTSGSASVPSEPASSATQDGPDAFVDARSDESADPDDTGAATGALTDAADAGPVTPFELPSSPGSPAAANPIVPEASGAVSEPLAPELEPEPQRALQRLAESVDAATPTPAEPEPEARARARTRARARARSRARTGAVVDAGGRGESRTGYGRRRRSAHLHLGHDSRLRRRVARRRYRSASPGQRSRARRG